MRQRPASSLPPAYLGIECGGTHSVAILATADGRRLSQVTAGPANLRLLTDPDLTNHLRSMARAFPTPSALGIGMAGAREESDRRRVRTAASAVWPGVPCWVGNDLETALAAAASEPPGPRKPPAARIVVISGTGSCCYGQNRRGRTAKVGGWGHLLGDRGSAYHLALRALQRVVELSDQTGRWPKLGGRLLRALQLNEPNELITWLLGAPKAAVAALAPEVFAAAAARDALARQLVTQAAVLLATDAVACARRLADRKQRVEFVLTGGLFTHQPGFKARVARELRRHWPVSFVRRLERVGAWGAVRLAQTRVDEAPITAEGRPRIAKAKPAPGTAGRTPRTTSATMVPIATAPSPTEARNPRSMDLDRRSVASAIELMLTEDARIPGCLLTQRVPIQRAVNLVAAAFQRGGRLLYVGAGTSGRLGVLDASECPPTFRTPPEMVQGIIAGGQSALWRSIEGAEDDLAAGGQSVLFRGVSSKDVVLGIAASGRTPFVWGALQVARQRGAAIVLLCFNPHLRFAPGMKPDIVIAPDLGPEILTGSTRLKAGTATKLVLNILTTLAMVRLGKVASNLMVDLNPSNTKLRARAERIVSELTGASPSAAGTALENSGWVVTRAIDRLKAAGRAKR